MFFNDDYKKVLQQGKDARTLLAYVEAENTITAEDLRQALKSGFAGRLEIVEDSKTSRLSYCTGQYFPTEYRAAACAVLASAIWNQIRRLPNMETGHDIRKHAGRLFGRGIASRWFN